MSMRTPKPLDLPRLLQALTEAGVEFVVVGGLAVIAHGYQRVTTDLDICYARDQNTARALLRALRSLNAQFLDDQYRPHPLPTGFRTLQRGGVFTFTTDAGELDCMTAPDGTTGYEDLIAGARVFAFRGMVAHVASLEDLIRMKEASGKKERRAKDRDDLEVLRHLRDLAQHHSPRRRARRSSSRPPAQAAQGDRIWVPGYERADETKVAGHWRRRPGHAR